MAGGLRLFRRLAIVVAAADLGLIADGGTASQRAAAASACLALCAIAMIGTGG